MVGSDFCRKIDVRELEINRIQPNVQVSRLDPIMTQKFFLDKIFLNIVTVLSVFYKPLPLLLPSYR